MTFNIESKDERLKKSLFLFKKYNQLYVDTNMKIKAVNNDKEGYIIKCNEDEYIIYYHKIYDFYSALLYLLANKEKNLHRTGIKHCKNFGLLLSISGGGVPTLDAIRNYIINAALLGYNFIELSIDDCMELEDEPYYGYLRGRYKKDEIKEIVKFADLFDIEIIPCVQILGHLELVLQHPVYSKIADVQDILLCGEENTYNFIEKIISTCRECFKSEKINICFDESEFIGLGKYLKKNGFVKQIDIMINHLNRVIDICKKYNFKVSMWSDMFFKTEFGSYFAPNKNFKDETIEKIPKDVDLIYWDYYRTDTNIYDRILSQHEQLVSKDRIQYAGAAWTFSGFAPLIGYTDKSMKSALDACIKHSLKTFILTLWADDCAECSWNSILSSMVLLGEYNYLGPISEEIISNKVKLLTNYTKSEWECLELPNIIFDEYYPSKGNPAKYFFYQDLILGKYDNYARMDDEKKHKKNAITLLQLSSRDSKYSYLFDLMAKLEFVLSIKECLGLKIRKAYENKDNQGMRECIKNIDGLYHYLNNFYMSFKDCWYKEKKGFGFEVHDARIGGLKQRIIHVKDILMKYLTDKNERIEELESKILYLNPKDEINNDEVRSYVCGPLYRKIITTGRM